MSIVSTLKSMLVQKVFLHVYQDNECTIPVISPELAMFIAGVPLHFNPSSLTTSHNTGYQEIRGIASGGTSHRRQQEPFAAMSFEFTLDSSLAERRLYSVEQITQALTVLVHGEDALAGTPPYVKFSWGENTFSGLATNITITRKLFARSGEVQQATVGMSIQGVKLGKKTLPGIMAKIPAISIPDKTLLPAVMAMITAAGVSSAVAISVASANEGDQLNYVDTANDNGFDSLNQPAVGETLTISP